jgi:hypothetical protein
MGGGSDHRRRSSSVTPRGDPIRLSPVRSLPIRPVSFCGLGPLTVCGDSASSPPPRSFRVRRGLVTKMPLRPSTVEHHGVHDAARREREQSGDDKRPKEQAKHRAAVQLDLMLVRPPYRERQHRQREDG